MTFDSPRIVICGAASAPSASLFAALPPNASSCLSLCVWRKSLPAFFVGSLSPKPSILEDLRVGDVHDRVGPSEQLLERRDADVGDRDPSGEKFGRSTWVRSPAPNVMLCVGRSGALLSVPGSNGAKRTVLPPNEAVRREAFSRL